MMPLRDDGQEQETSDVASARLRNSSSANAAGGPERIVLIALIGLVALVPLPLASNRPLPAAVLSLCTGLLVAVWAVLFDRQRRPLPVAAGRIRWSLILFALCCFWIFIQWLPIARLADPIWGVAAQTLGNSLTGRISVNPNETMNGLMRLLAYAGVFWLSLQLTRKPSHAERAITSVAAIGAAYAAYGVLIYLSGNHWILGYSKWAYPDSLTSTFVNRNSFAAFTGLCLLCAYYKLMGRLKPALDSRRPLRQKIVLVIESLTTRAIWPMAACLLMTVALVLTSSRGGVLVSIAAIAVLLLVFASGKRRSRRRGLLVAAVVLVGITGLALATSGGRLSDRYADEGASLSGRTAVFDIALNMIGTSPWTGTGFGTFAYVFPAFRGAGANPLVTWDKAHSTYLENAIELGIPAALALDLSIALLALLAVQGLRNRKRSRAIPGIGVAATVLVGLHSFVDFSLQIPAVSVLYAFMLGFAVSQSWSAERGEERAPAED